MKTTALIPSTYVEAIEWPYQQLIWHHFPLPPRFTLVRPFEWSYQQLIEHHFPLPPQFTLVRPLSDLTNNWLSIISLSLTSVHTSETTEWPHQQLGTVGVDTSAGVLVANDHLLTACQRLSQVDRMLVLWVAYTSQAVCRMQKAAEPSLKHGRQSAEIDVGCASHSLMFSGCRFVQLQKFSLAKETRCNI